MKNIIKQLQEHRILTILHLNEKECRATFYFDGQLIGEVECPKTTLTHERGEMIKGLETNYGWLGLYYKLPIRAKNIQTETNENIA